MKEEKGKEARKLIGKKHLVDLNIRARRVHLQGVIDEDTTRGVIEELLLLNSISHTPITLVINSPGGTVTGTLAIIDVMEAIKSDVNTVIVGQACSGAALVSICGAKREMSRRAIWMIHPMAAGVVDYHSFMKDKMKGIAMLDKSIIDLLTKQTHLPAAIRKKSKTGEIWLTAKQCKKYKVVDKIVTRIG